MWEHNSCCYFIAIGGWTDMITFIYGGIWKEVQYQEEYLILLKFIAKKPWQFNSVVIIFKSTIT